MRRTIVGQAVLIAAMLSGSAFTAADVLSTVPEGVARYARDIDAAIKSSGPISLEPIFDEGLAAADVVLEQLERFDESTYRKVQSMMVGFAVGREEILVAAPLSEFFLKLAREKGTSVDRAFFEALKKTYPEGVWPAYYGPITDYSGCTIFDGTLLELYRAWVAFHKSYPDHYQEPARRELAQIEGALASTCACGGEEEVQKELENFLHTYPSSPMVTRVALRLEAVKNRTSQIRFHCRPG